MINQALANLCHVSKPVGSRVTCSPPPTDTDEDWLCLAHDVVQFVEAAEAEGFTQGGSGHVIDEPMSFDHVHGLTAKDPSTRAIKAATETLMRGYLILITMRVRKDGRLEFVRAEDT